MRKNSTQFDAWGFVLMKYLPEINQYHSKLLTCFSLDMEIIYTKRQDFCAYLIFAVPVAPLPCWPECRWDGQLSDGWVHLGRGPPCEHHLQQPMRQKCI